MLGDEIFAILRLDKSDHAANDVVSVAVGEEGSSTARGADISGGKGRRRRRRTQR